jgi:predicted transcriptional regulator
MIGLFLQNAARMSYQQLMTRRALEGESVRSLMITDPITVPPAITIKELVEEYIYKHHYKMFPVVDRGKLVGCVTTRQIRQVPKEDWPHKKVSEIANTCSAENTIQPDTDVVKVLRLMNRTRNSRLMVIEGQSLLGIIALKDIMDFLSIKLDLDQYEE